MPSTFSSVAGGNISPARFLVAGTASGGTVIQATGTGTAIVGISQPGTRGPDGTPFGTDGFAAIAGQQVVVFDNQNEDEVLLALGTAITGVAPGILLTSDSSGRGIPITATGQAIGAQTLFTTVSGVNAFARVRPRFGFS